MSELSERLANLSPAKRRLLEELASKGPELAEPIAVVGMACRFPGAPNAEAFWRLIHDRIDATGEIPASRWDIEEFYDPTGEVPGKMSTRWGGFLDNVDRFDPLFFGITPREAEKVDPQHRLVLEVAWEALEVAGLAPDRLRGFPMGVFLGIGGVDYSRVLARRDDYFEQINAYSGTGNALSIAANRLSYFLDLRGPSLAVDTACSSALVAVHLAVRSLRSRECDAALAGSVNLILSPETTLAFSDARLLSPDGKCRPFDARANGYVRGEGCGILVLKRLSDAISAGDQLLAVLRSTAVNQDGRTSGITAPNGLSQQAVIRKALAEAGLTTEQVSYIEAHGTGTPLGDPIEAEALGELFRRRSPRDPICYLGSVKANIGHTETSAGVAGIIKVILMMQHGCIPGQTHFNSLNPHISLEGTRLWVPQEPVAWRSEGARIAGVSAFGFGGTNAHVVLEQPRRPDPKPAKAERPLHAMVLSAKTNQALDELALAYRDYLGQHPDVSLADVGHTAAVGRSHFQHRLALVAQNPEQAGDLLAAVADGKPARRIRRGTASAVVFPKVAFLFTGQGAQHVDMGRRLFETQPVFRDALLRCDEILGDSLGERLLNVVYGGRIGGSRLDETIYTQPALFALEYALANLWRCWGIEPDVVLGHSIGEYAAACFAGVFSLEEGLRLVAHRARLIQGLPRDGSMAVVFAGPDRVADPVARYHAEVSIAAINGPENTVISGKAEAVQELVARFADEGAGTQKLSVSHAFHSPLMDPILDEFESLAREVEYHPPRVPLASNLTGQLITDQPLDARYWRSHIRSPVRFAEGMQRLAECEPDVMLEIGPSTTLLGMARRCLPKSKSAWLPSLRKGRDDWKVILDALCELYVRGAKIHWAGFDQPWPRHRLMLPTYPFQRTRSWYRDEDRSKSRMPGAASGPVLHPLLGRRVPTALAKTLYQSTLSAHWPGYLTDHRVQGSPIVPAAAYVEQALAAAELAFGKGRHVVENVSIQQAMNLNETTGRTVQLIVSPETGGQCSFELYSRWTETEEDPAKATWLLHACGTLRHEDGATGEPTRLIDMDDVRARSVGVTSQDEFYREMARRGLAYGPSFQVLDALSQTEREALARVRLPESVSRESADYCLHPALLDGCFQTMAGVVPVEKKDGGSSPLTYVPTQVRQVRPYGRAADAAWTYAVRTSSHDGPSPEMVEGDVFLLDGSGQVVVELSGVRVQRVGRSGATEKKAEMREWLYAVRWEPQPLPEATAGNGKPSRTQATDWLIFADQSGVGQALAGQLERRGARCTAVLPGNEFRRLGRKGTALCEACEMDPLSPDDYRNLLTAYDPAEYTPIQVVHLWSVDLGAPGADGDDALQTARRLGCGSVLQLIKEVARAGLSPAPRLALVTRGAQAIDEGAPVAVLQGPLWGMGRVAAIEHPEFRCRLIDLDPKADLDDSATRLVDELTGQSEENQIVLRNGVRHVARLVRTPDTLPADEVARASTIPPLGPFHLRLHRPGDFDSLGYEALSRKSPGPGQVEIEVHYAALNFSDVLKAMGLYPGMTDEVVPLGIECSGVVASVGEGVERLRVGDAVLGVAPYSFGSHTISAEYALAPRPESLAGDEACAIPITFLTAYYALRRLANLQRGERVLIHAAAGGVGLAAIQIAQHVGAEIFATAGSDRKREYLRSLGVGHVMNSRTLEFADQILEATGRGGVDVVLNSLPGDAIPKSLSVLSAYGRFVEIGKTDIYQNRMIGLLPFQDNLSYFAIDLDRMLRQRPEYVRQMLAEVMEHFERGHYRPLPVTRFSAEQIVDAFRYMAQRKNIGKIVVSYDAVAERRDDSPAGPFGGASSTSHRWKGPIRPDGTYLITGGLGALGLQLARWLADHGAGHVALLGRSVPGEQAARTIDELRRSGVEVAVLQGDVTDRRSLAAALSAIPDGFPPLRGAFHAAGVLADGLMFDMELAQLDKAMAPKVQGAWNLHEQTQDTPLDWFVLFSSVASVLGSPGQANYAAGNAFLGGLAEYRRSLGLPAMSINWGPWAQSGMAAQDQTQAQIASRGLDLMPPEKALELLGGMLRTKPTEVAVMDVRWQDVTAGMRRPAPLLKHVVGETDELADAPRGETVNEAFCEELRQSEPERREALLRDYVAGEVCAVMSMDRDDLDMDEPLSTLGLDSLMGMELKIKLESRLGLDLPMGSLFENPTVASLAALAEKSFADDGRTPDGEGPDTHHATGPEDSAWSPLARLASGGSPPSLFCVHPVGGDVRCYFALAQRLRGIRPVWAFRTRGLDGRTEPHASMDQMMADYLRTLQQVQPEGPCYLVGWSTGGIFALELARRLREERQSLGGLILIDTPRPSIFHQAELDDDARFLYDLVNFSNWFAGTEMRVSYEELHRQGSERSLEIVLEEAKRHRVLSDSGSLEHLRRLVRVCKEHVRIVLGYDPKPFDQPVHLIRPEDTGSLMEASGQNLDDDLGWGSILGDRVVTHEVPGNHFSMMTSKNAGPLAELILDILAGAGAVRSTA